MRVLLINSNSYVSPYPVYPLGLCCVAASAAMAGHEVRLFDMNLSGTGLEVAIKEYAPECVGLSIRNIDDCHIEGTRFLVMHEVELANSIRKMTNAPIVLGGSGYSIYPVSLLLATGADYGIQGSGEEGFAKLLDGIQRGDFEPSQIPGLVYRVDGKAVANEPACGMHSPLIPWRPHELVLYYLNNSGMLNIQTQRGCSFSCCYCSYPLIEGRSFHRRDPVEIANECELIKALGARYFFVVDSVFNTSVDHVAGICEELIRRDVGLSWGCFLRPKGLTSELASLMARAGLLHVEFGSDSFSDTVLDCYGKGFTFEDIYVSSEMVRAAGIRYCHFLIVGGPGETEATLHESYKNSKRLKKTVIFPFVGMRLYPKTPLFERAINEGLITRDAQLLEPFFYVSPFVTKMRIFELIRHFSKETRNWVLNEPSAETLRITALLRQRGVVGPMWEFLST